ncbi:MAG TPA: PRC and DUF2382 domain-containing protein [Mycobacteriales bacterium]|nr:PRC and DUF2382 domain-containing protein [Mycobacteriales bacterium]
MISEHDLTSLPGTPVVGADGHKIGKVADVYESTDGETGTFVTVSTGLFGSHASFVPLDEATLQGNSLVVPYDKDLVKDAPRVAADEELSSQEEDRLYAHYRLSGSRSGDGYERSYDESATGTTTVGRGQVGHDTSGPTTDEAMTRSEERLQVGTQRVETGRARLRKRIVTENVTQTVPVTSEQVRVVREPVTEANVGSALSGPDLSEEEHEVVLHAEKAVVTKETVPVERVRLDTDVVRDEVRVDETVRSEQIELDEDVPTRQR